MATRAELRHLVWRLYGVRADHRAPARHLEGLVLLKIRTTPENPINDMRRELIQFVADNTERLSLFCDGKCDGHTDATVLFCYAQLEEARSGEAKGESGTQDHEEDAGRDCPADVP